ncbi:collagen-binding domain-containing protein [Photobacterium sanctipauli]|nr:collagen-binding domain-containing protein [Photobacterium sanctipauli]
MLKPATLLAISVTFIPLSHASPLDLLNNHQLIVFEDLESTSEVGGTAIIAGDLNGTASNYATHMSQAMPSGDGLVIGGDLNVNVQVNNNYGAIVGGSNNGIVSLNGPSSGLSSDTSNYDFSQIQAELSQFSTFLASLPSNSLLTQPLGCCNNASFDVGNSVGSLAAVFNIDKEDIFENPLINSYSLNLNSQMPSAIVINVAGENIDDSTFSFNAIGDFVSEAIAELVIWNFYQSETLNLTKAIHGSILAPLAELTNHTEIKGSVAVKSHFQYGKIWGPTFAGIVPATEDPSPAPAPNPLAFMALIVGFLCWRYRVAA